jgi:hypothetical protein
LGRERRAIEGRGVCFKELEETSEKHGASVESARRARRNTNRALGPCSTKIGEGRAANAAEISFSNLNLPHTIHTNTASQLVPHTQNGPMDVPWCWALRLLQKPLYYMGVHLNGCPAFVYV